ncbi:CPBP family intramembrane glutamic endopeptidase [Legionella dresdenensis]|uniref:CPBP family intramembrane glutamic endopeptidase n=1 Tax=Legionella dresdenensis TaxID=450200 RepID=A0ABV8CG97_9GAMM
MMTYPEASIVNLTLGSFFISSHIYDRWLSKSALSLMDTNALVKLFIVAIGFFTIPLKSLVSGTLSLQIQYLIIGVFLGYVYFNFEIWFIKILPGKYKLLPRENNSIKINKLNIKNLLNSSTRSFKKKNEFSLTSIFFIAVSEEIIYRGFLTTFCMEFPLNWLNIVYLVLVNLIFALSHINIGFVHVITKFILGWTCLIAYLLSGTVLTPIAIHSVFNLLAVKKLKERLNA